MFFYPVLDALSDGKIIRRSVSLGLQGLAVLWALGGVYLLIEILKVAFRLPTEGTIGGLIFAAVFIAAIGSIFQIYWYRARSVAELGDGAFTVIPIVSILMRLMGETYATLCLSLGLGGCVFMWLAKVNPMRMLGGLGMLMPSMAGSSDDGFVAGIMFLVTMALMAFFMLILFYFLAESVVVLVDIARTLKSMSKGGGMAMAAAAPAPAPAPARYTPPAAPAYNPPPAQYTPPQAPYMPPASQGYTPTMRASVSHTPLPSQPQPSQHSSFSCPTCGAELEAGAKFCAGCGGRVGGR